MKSKSFENMNLFFDKIRTVGFFERLFCWKKILLCSSDAFLEFQMMNKPLSEIYEMRNNDEVKVKLLKKENDNLSKNKLILENINSNNLIIGTVRDVRGNKNDKPRIEIHFKLEFESFFQEYGYTKPRGYPIIIIINEKEYNIGFHKTLSNKYMWLSSRLDRDGYQLADVLLSSGFSRNEEIQLKRVGKDRYQLEKVNLLLL